MSSLSGYDAVVVVAAQQHDSASPPAASKHVVDDAFQEWLHKLKALVADAPAYVRWLCSICMRLHSHFRISFTEHSTRI